MTDEVIVPVKIDENALEGLDIVDGQIEDAKALNPSLTLKGVLITIYQNTDGEAAGLDGSGRNGTMQKASITGSIRFLAGFGILQRWQKIPL